MKIKGIIFDFDGTVLDTETPELNAWLEVFSKYEVQFPMDFYIENVGAGQFTDFITDTLIEQYSSEELDKEDILNEFLNEARIFLLKEKVLPGIMDYLHEASINDIKLAIASSSNAEWVRSNLKRLNIIEYFDSIVTSDDVSYLKPKPDLFLCALANLGLSKHQVIVIEDSLNGVEAAKSAGLFTIAVPNKVTMNFDFSHADVILEKLSDLPFQKLMDI